MNEQAFQQWAIVELFGHQRIAGLVSEQVIAGQGFVRVDVPACKEREGFTRMFGTGAIYSIIPTSEEIATAFASANVDKPVSPYQLALPRMIDSEPGEDDEDDSDF
jgi:hypothetical protein